ncbi:MAG: adenylosuccinate synthetase, partial [Anaerolineales bacterium]
TMTKLDVLSGFEEVNICNAYRSHGKTYPHLPLGPADLSPFEPLYSSLPGWKEEIRGCRNWQDLPNAAQNFIYKVAELVQVPIHLVSVGPEREDVIEVPHP